MLSSELVKTHKRDMLDRPGHKQAERFPHQPKFIETETCMVKRDWKCLKVN